jgi:tetratricopeptide (TPR) repeat protein
MLESPKKTTKKMNPDKEILIEKYFEKQLSANEKQLFDEALKNDEDFKTAFEFEKDVKDGIHFLERDSLKKMLKGFEEKPQKKIIPFSNWLWLGAAAMLIIGISIWLYPDNQANSDELYLSYYQSYPNVVAPIVRGENIQDEKQKAFEAYEQEKYQTSQTLFHQIFEKNKEEYAVFYEAQSYFALGETQKGIQLLENFNFSDGKYPFKTQQRWYLALGYLKLKDLEKTKQYLQTLTVYDNPQKENAKKLLESLP